MFHFTAICRQTESRTLHVAYFSTINVFALCEFILLLSFKNEAVIYLIRGDYSKHFGNRTIGRSVLLSLVIDHDNRREWMRERMIRHLQRGEFSLYPFGRFALSGNDADIVESFQVEVVCRKIKYKSQYRQYFFTGFIEQLSEWARIGKFGEHPNWNLDK